VKRPRETQLSRTFFSSLNKKSAVIITHTLDTALRQ
jgi:hypothetical protein